MAIILQIVNVLWAVMLLNVLLPTAAQTLSGTSVILGKKHYYIETTNQGNFYEAAHNCAQLGMSLASLDSNTDEYKRIIGFLTTNELQTNEYWLSGIKLDSAATVHTWLGTGKTVKGLAVVNDCVGTDATFALASLTCTEEHYYICEKPLEPYCGKFGQCHYTSSTSSK